MDPEKQEPSTKLQETSAKDNNKAVNSRQDDGINASPVKSNKSNQDNLLKKSIHSNLSPTPQNSADYQSSVEEDIQAV